MERTGDITTLLSRLTEGDGRAVDQLLPAVYDELRALASSYLRREHAGHMLQTTALVHEAWIRLQNERGGGLIRWRSRTR